MSSPTGGTAVVSWSKTRYPLLSTDHTPGGKYIIGGI